MIPTNQYHLGVREGPLLAVLVVVTLCLVGGAAQAGDEQPSSVPQDGGDMAATGTAGEHRVLVLQNVGRIRARAAALLLSNQGGGEIDGAITWTIRPGTVPGTVPLAAEQPAAAPATAPAATAAITTPTAADPGMLPPAPYTVGAPAAGAPAAGAPAAGAPAAGEPAVAGAAEKVVVPEPRVSVPYFVEIDGASLLEQHRGERLSIGVYGYFLSSSGEIVGHFARGASVLLADYRELLLSSGIRLAAEQQLAPGTYSLRVLVRNHQTDRFYLGRTSIDIPAAGSEQWMVLQPFFPSAGEWVVAQVAEDEPVAPLPSPAGPVSPSARPVLVDGKRTTFLIGGTGWNESVRATARLVDYNGRTYDEPEVIIGPRLPGYGETLSMHQATIAATDMPAGKFRLVLGLKGEGTEQRATRTLTVFVVPAEAPLAWAAIDLTELRRPSERTGTGFKKIKELKLAESYRKALERLAAGDELAARRAVAELERAAFAIDPGKALTELRDIELKMARFLLDEQPEGLAPVLMLHHDLVHSYTVRSDYTLTTHSWMLAAELAELACRDDRSRECRLRTARTLVSLACYMLDVESSDAATALFNRALRFDPGNPTALFGMAVLYERRGQYTKAIPLFDRLVKRDPGNFEGKLHLAVNTARMGRQKSANRMFKDLIRSGAPRWMKAVAFQELASSLIEGKHYTAAEQLLLDATQSLPENQRLQMQLAYVFDLSQRPWESAQVMEQVRPYRGGSEDSPRLRYASWRPAAFQGVRHDLVRSARGFFPALGESLTRARKTKRWASRRKDLFFASPRLRRPHGKGLPTMTGRASLPMAPPPRGLQGRMVRRAPIRVSRESFEVGAGRQP